MTGTFPTIPSVSRLDTVRPITQSLIDLRVLVRSGDSHITRWIGGLHDAQDAKHATVSDFDWHWNERSYGRGSRGSHIKARSVALPVLLNALARMDDLDRTLTVDRLLPKLNHAGKAAFTWVHGDNDPTGTTWVTRHGNTRLLGLLTHDLNVTIGADATAAWVRSWVDPLPEPSHALHTAVPREVRNALAGIPADDPWADDWRNPETVAAFRAYDLTPDDLDRYDTVGKWTCTWADFAGCVALLIERDWTPGRATRFAGAISGRSKPSGHRPTQGRSNLLPRLEAFASLLDDGLTVTDATAWVKAGARGPRAAQDRRAYLDLGFDITTAGPWMGSRLVPEVAAQWRDAGADPSLAADLWETVGVRDADAAAYASVEARYAVSAWLALLEAVDARDLRALRCAHLVDKANVLDGEWGLSMTQKRERTAQLVAELSASGEELDAVHAMLALVKPSDEGALRSSLGLHGLLMAA